VKRILYLDKAFMESYMAQEHGGLEGQRTYATTNGTVENQELTTPSITHQVGGEGKAGIGVAAGSIHYQHEFISESRTSGHADIDGAIEAVTLMMHDNALEEVIRLSGANNREGDDVGEFAIVTGAHPLVYDIQAILQRMSKDAIEFNAVKQWKEHLKKLTVPDAKEIQKGEKAYIAAQRNMLNEAKKTLEMTCLFAQFDICLVIGDTIAPMKRECMRTTSNDIIFKYADRLFAFGQITRIFAQKKNEPSANPLEQLNSIFNGAWPDALVKMDILPANGYRVLDPMAIYFE